MDFQLLVIGPVHQSVNRHVPAELNVRHRNIGHLEVSEVQRDRVDRQQNGHRDLRHAAERALGPVDVRQHEPQVVGLGSRGGRQPERGHVFSVGGLQPQQGQSEEQRRGRESRHHDGVKCGKV